MESTNNIEYDLKDDIELTDLTINYDYMWQDIIKSFYDIDKDVNIDDIIKDINLDKIHDPFSLYLREKYQEYERIKTEDDYKKLRTKFENDWNNNIVDKNYYIKKYHHLKNMYDLNIAIIRKYLLLYRDFNKKNNQVFDIYFIEQILINNGKDDIDVIRDLAQTKWINNENNIKDKYNKMFEKITKYINKNKDKKYITGLTLFMKEQIDSNAKLKNKEVQYFKNLWKKLGCGQKKKYMNKAKIENIKNEVILNINEYSSGKIEISQRITPYQLFRKEFRDLDYCYTVSNCRKKFNNLDDHIKRLYDIKCHRLNLINSYKKMVINMEKKRLKYKKAIQQKIKNLKEKKIEINAEKNIINKKENNNSQINIVNDNHINNNIIDNNIENELDLDTDYKVYEEPPKPKFAYDYFFELNRHKFTGDDCSDIIYDLWNQMEQKEKFEYIHQEYNNNRLYKYRLKEFKDKGYYDRTKTLINYENNYIEINNRTYSIPIEPPTAKDVFIYTYIERNHLPYNKENIDALSNIWETELDDNIKLSYIEIEKSNRILYMYRMHEYKNYGYYDKNKTIDDYESL